jgi:hypothetical protein
VDRHPGHVHNFFWGGGGACFFLLVTIQTPNQDVNTLQLLSQPGSYHTAASLPTASRPNAFFVAR